IAWRSCGTFLERQKNRRLGELVRNPSVRRRTAGSQAGMPQRHDQRPGTKHKSEDTRMAHYDPNDPKRTEGIDPQRPAAAPETYVEPVERRASPLPLIIGILLALAIAYF